MTTTYMKAESAPKGFTLVEVLVVIAIVGALVGLLIPAVQAAREAARRTSCANNLKQHASAILQHEVQHGIFPTGGWGANWVGDPDQGYGADQPGGWVYNILPYIEQQNLRRLGSGLPTEQKKSSLSMLMESPINIFNCPTRRRSTTYPYNGPNTLKNALPPLRVAKTDYAINQAISFEKSDIIFSEIQLQGNGVSKTVAVGEKNLLRAAYFSGQGSGDGLSMYAGDSIDIRRAVSGPPVPDATGDGSTFGGPHPGGCNVAYCDGSVRFVNEDEALEEKKPR